MTWDYNYTFADMWKDIGERLEYEAPSFPYLWIHIGHQMSLELKVKEAHEQRLYSQVNSVFGSEPMRQLDLLKLVEETLK